MSEPDSPLEEIVKEGTLRLEIQASRSSKWTWTLTLYDGPKETDKVDTFEAKHIPFHDCSCVKAWLSNHNATSLCIPTEKKILSLNQKLGHFH